MLRTTLPLSYIKRPCRPIYAWTQATPTQCYLDPGWDNSVNIYPGMAMMKTGGDNVTLLNTTGPIYGLATLFVGGYGFNEVTDQGVNAFACWILGPDAQFEIDAPSFDSTLSTWIDPGNATTGTELLISAYTGAGGSTRGQLAPLGTSNAHAVPFARLIKVNSAQTITIGGLSAMNAYGT